MTRTKFKFSQKLREHLANMFATGIITPSQFINKIAISKFTKYYEKN